MKWMLWNDGVEMAEFGTRVRIGLFQHALAHREANGERFESIGAKLDELRSYLYANRESVMGIRRSIPERRVYFDRACGVHRQSIDQVAHVQEMGWGRAGAQYLLHVKTAIINGRLDRYTGHHSVRADIAA
jgi:hypothetical protein